MEYGITKTHLTERRNTLEKLKMRKLPTTRPTRWGILSAGLISNDFITAVQLLPAKDHKVNMVAVLLYFLLSTSARVLS